MQSLSFTLIPFLRLEKWQINIGRIDSSPGALPSGETTLQFVERNAFEMAPYEILVLPSCFSKLHRLRVQHHTTNSEINDRLLPVYQNCRQVEHVLKPINWLLWRINFHGLTRWLRIGFPRKYTQCIPLKAIAFKPKTSLPKPSAEQAVSFCRCFPWSKKHSFEGMSGLVILCHKINDESTKFLCYEWKPIALSKKAEKSAGFPGGNGFSCVRSFSVMVSCSVL